MGLYLESPGTGDLLTNCQLKFIVGKIIAIQVVKKHRTFNTLQILLSVYSQYLASGALSVYVYTYIPVHPDPHYIWAMCLI